MAVKEPPFDVGDEVVLFAQYVAEDGTTPATPDEVVLQVGKPDGEVLHTWTLGALELDVPTAGTVEKRYVIEAPNLVFSFDATGGVTIASEGQIPMRRRTLARPT